MRITILTLFPEMFDSPFNSSIIKRAKDKNKIEIEIINIRDFGLGKHKIVDDTPYGGGVGMLLRIDVAEKAIESVKCNKSKKAKKKCKEKVILLDPQGEILKQANVVKLSKIDHLILICAHYEGIDERVRKMVDEEISIGDFILTGGELPAMVLTDAIIRLIPSVLGKDESIQFESFQEIDYNTKKVKILEYPQYTRPENYKGLKVPKILLSGNHGEIDKWRLKEALQKTRRRRPDLLKNN